MRYRILEEVSINDPTNILSVWQFVATFFIRFGNWLTPSHKLQCWNVALLGQSGSFLHYVTIFIRPAEPIKLADQLFSTLRFIYILIKYKYD